MRKTAMITAGLVLGASLFTGCGSSDDKSGSASAGGDYCDTLKSVAANIKSFTAADATPDFSKFEDFLADAKKLADKAPDSIADDWDTMLGAMKGLTDALDEAGISLEDLMKASTTGELPEGVDMAKLQALGTKVESLSGAEVTKATDAIDKHAKDECKVSLSDS